MVFKKFFFKIHSAFPNTQNLVRWLTAYNYDVSRVVYFCLRKMCSILNSHISELTNLVGISNGEVLSIKYLLRQHPQSCPLDGIINLEASHDISSVLSWHTNDCYLNDLALDPVWTASERKG